MKVKLYLAVATLAIMGAGTAHAQDFSAVVTPNPDGIGVGGSVDEAFSATITNTNPTGATETIDSDSIGALPVSGVNLLSDGIQNYLLANGPITLGPGASIVFGAGGVAPDAFDLSIAPGTASFTGDLYVSNSTSGDSDNPNGYGPGNPNSPAGASGPGNPYGNFTVNVAAVPEPGSLALLSGMAGFGAVLFRRARR